MPRLRILHVTPECFPYAKVGGLGDVAGALPLALAARGHDVRVVMPRYRVTKSKPSTPLRGALGVPVGQHTAWAGVHRAPLSSAGRGLPDVPLYLLEHDVLFDRDGIYGDANGGFGDNLARYAFLSRGALALCDYLGFEPDVVHVHDWPTCLVPLYLDQLGPEVPLRRAATVLSIHNMAYQGWFPRSELGATGLRVPSAALSALDMHGNLNLLKAGIVRSTLVSTVSPRYAHEIQSPEGGEGLDGLLRMRGSDVVGVLNGIDEWVWNPETDPYIEAHFGADDLSGKAHCKAALQREMGLEQRPDVPLLGLVGRLVDQKGIDLFAGALERVLAQDVQVVLLGAGDRWAEGFFRQLSHTSRSFRAYIGQSEALAHRIEAGADLFVMPSRYEPCGLNQMYSQRYGTLPIVRAVGGLDDTVEHDETGFKFDDVSPEALAEAIGWAVWVYRNAPERFRAMQHRAMTKPMGWSNAARQYEALYRLAMARRAGRI
jgi:starch synthase